MQTRQLRDSLKAGFAKQQQTMEESFRGLSAEQLNWAPDDKTWSIGQCLYHIWLTNDKYLANLATVIRASERKEPKNQDYNSSMVGTRFIEMVGATGGKNTPVPKMLVPEKNRVPREVVQLVIDQLEGIQEFLAESEGKDLRKTKMASPIMKIIRLPLGDVFLALKGHNDRHLNQAARMLRMSGAATGVKTGVS